MEFLILPEQCLGYRNLAALYRVARRLLMLKKWKQGSWILSFYPIGIEKKGSFEILTNFLGWRLVEHSLLTGQNHRIFHLRASRYALFSVISRNSSAAGTVAQLTKGSKLWHEFQADWDWFVNDTLEQHNKINLPPSCRRQSYLPVQMWKENKEKMERVKQDNYLWKLEIMDERQRCQRNNNNKKRR